MRCQCEKISTLGDCYYCVSGIATGPLDIPINFTKLSPQVGKKQTMFSIAIIRMFTSLVLNQKELLGLTPYKYAMNYGLNFLNLRLQRYETEVDLFLNAKIPLSKKLHSSLLLYPSPPNERVLLLTPVRVLQVSSSFPILPL
jgi:hypothetical protein